MAPEGNGYRYRYDTPVELDLLNDLWEVVNLRKNYLLPTKKATGWRETAQGQAQRIDHARAMTLAQRDASWPTLTRANTSEARDHISRAP